MVLQVLVERCVRRRVLSLFDYRMACQKRCILCWISRRGRNEGENAEIEMKRAYPYLSICLFEEVHRIWEKIGSDSDLWVTSGRLWNDRKY